jgi:alpha-L-fucosidase
MPDGSTNLHGLPPEAAGDYAGFIKKQMTELLSNYGQIDLVWCDQYEYDLTRAQWLEVKAHMQALQPNCIVVGNNSSTLDVSDVYSYEIPIRKSPFPSTNKLPAEACDVISKPGKGGWFWNGTATPENTRTAAEVVEKLKFYNERNCNYLLNVGPNRDGLLDPYAVEVLKEIGRLTAKGSEPSGTKASAK